MSNSVELRSPLLSREILRIRGALGPEEDLEETIDDFEAPLI